MKTNGTGENFQTHSHIHFRVTQALSGQNFSKDDLDEMNGYTSFAVAVAREGKRLGKVRSHTILYTFKITPLPLFHSRDLMELSLSIRRSVKF